MLKTPRGYQRERCMQESQSTVWEADFRGMVLSPSLPLVIKPTRTDIDLDRSVKRADLLRWGEPYRGRETRAMALCGPAELPDGRVHRGGGAVPPRRWSFGRTVGAICATSTQTAVVAF